MELFMQYLEHCRYQRNLSDKTIKAYRIDLTQFLSYLDGKLIPSKDNITQYIMLLNKKYKPRTVKRKIAAIRAYCGYIEEQKIADNPMIGMRTHIQAPKILPRTIPLHSIEKILSAAYKVYNEQSGLRKQEALRNIAVLELLFATGIRVSELCGLNTEDVDLIEGSIMIFGKGAKERRLYIGSSATLSVLQRYLDSRISIQPALFVNRQGKRLSDQSVRAILRHLAELATPGLTITPHMFRHSFATLLLEDNVDIRYIQKMLGHSSIATTQVYTYVALAKQKEILLAHHPRNRILI